MYYKGKKLILDNFRNVLSGYSVDIQDVVRSAILDGIDISDYIDVCRTNPYLLDQIRLSIKDGLSASYLKIGDAEILYSIRQLNGLLDLKPLENQLKNNILSSDHIHYIIKWIKEGRNINTLNVSKIPLCLLETFDYGLRLGVRMNQFNNGISYKPEYLKNCIKIIKSGKGAEELLKNIYNDEVMDILVGFSRSTSNLWFELINNIDSNISKERVEILIRCIKSGMPIKKLQSKKKGKYLYSNECLELLHKAYINKLDINLIMEKSSNIEEMQSIVEELELKNSKKHSIQLRKY